MRHMNSPNRLPPGRYRWVTDLRTLSQCEYRFYLKKIHGDLPSDASVQGTWLHSQSIVNASPQTSSKRLVRFAALLLTIIAAAIWILGYATAAKNLYNLEYLVGGYKALLRIEWCGCSMLIARASK